MLILSRKMGETIKIGPDVEVIVSRISGNRVTIGIDAPRNVHVVRGEIEHIPKRSEGGRDGEAQKET